MPGYEALVPGYNVAYHGLRPRLITLARTREEVIGTIATCRRENWPLHIRGGGHSFEDLTTGPGVLLDMRRMNRVQLSSDGKTLTVEAGATLGQVQRALLPRGLVIPTGSCPSVGITGLTLGGGYGLGSRKYGLSCDALREVELIDASGRVAIASERQNPELFWALRGGGGAHLGVVTRLSFAPQPASERVSVLRARVRPEARREFLARWQSWIAGGTDQLTPLVYVAATPSGIDGPVLLAQYWGDRPGARVALEPFLPLLELPEIEECSALEAAQVFGGELDAPLKPTRFKSKSHFFKRELGDAQWDVLLRLLAPPIDGLLGLMLDPWQGAIRRVPHHDTAFAHRDALFSIQYRADWSAEAEAAASLASLQQVYDSLAPLSDGAYANYSDKSLSDWRTAYYGAHLERLTSVKRQFDPDGFFSHPLSL
jgi:FAD/FMN-containing dehydrogenase